jgi:hypothetical protein
MRSVMLSEKRSRKRPPGARCRKLLHLLQDLHELGAGPAMAVEDRIEPALPVG